MTSVLYRSKDNFQDFPFKFIRYRDRLFKQPLHHHDYVQIAYVFRGVCHHQLRGKTLTVGKGDIFIISPGMEHSLSAIPDQDFELVVLDFMPFFVHEQLNNFSETLYRHLRDEQQSVSSLLQPWLHINKTKQPLVEQLLQDIQDEFEHREPGYAFSIQINLIKLLILIDREYRRSERKPARVPALANRRQIQDAIRYINDNYGQDIPLEQGADVAGMAPAYFSHLFKKETGRTFVEFLHEVRIDRAMELIRRDDDSITQICFQVGFRQLSHFTRTFKKRTGLTPTEYKKTFGAQAQTI